MRLQFKLLSPINFAAFNTRCLRSRRATKGSGEATFMNGNDAAILRKYESKWEFMFRTQVCLRKGKEWSRSGERRSQSACIELSLIGKSHSFESFCGCKGGRKVLSKWINIAGEKKGCQGRQSLPEVFPFRWDFGTGKVNFQSIRQLFICEAIRRL